MYKTSTTLNELLNAGVHFGHHPKRWHPKMRPYIYGEKANVHIIDLGKTFVMLQNAMEALSDVVVRGGRVLFVGTKRQATEVVALAAQQCGQHFVNTRWLGGTLTNWQTVQKSIVRMENLEKLLADERRAQAMTKKERILVERDLAKLMRSFGGLRNMGGLPDMLFVLDAHKDMLAVHEARMLRIPVVAITDTNADPTFIDYPIPGNDDARSSVELYCREAVAAILHGLIAESERQASAEALEESGEMSEKSKKESGKKADGVKAKKASAQKEVSPKADAVKAEKAPAKKEGAPKADAVKVEQSPAKKESAPKVDAVKVEEAPAKKESAPKVDAVKVEEAPAKKESAPKVDAVKVEKAPAKKESAPKVDAVKVEKAPAKKEEAPKADAVKVEKAPAKKEEAKEAAPKSA